MQRIYNTSVEVLITFSLIFSSVIFCKSLSTGTANSKGVSPPLTNNYRYVGCYDVWKGNEGTPAISIFYKDLSLEQCAQFCKDQLSQATLDIIVVRGIYCECRSWTDFKLFPVEESLCHLNCVPSKTDIEEKDFTCGGNYAFSVYCNVTGVNAKICNEYEIPDIKGLENSWQNSQLLDLSDSKSKVVVPTITPIDEEVLPVYPCFKCENPYQCQWTLNASTAYFPENTPDLCLDFCRRDVIVSETNIRKMTTYAIVGWNNRNNNAIPFCRCTNEIHSTFKNDELDNCNKPCPVDQEIMCGGSPPFYFAMYCANSRLCSTDWKTTTEAKETTIETTELVTTTTESESTVDTTIPESTVDTTIVESTTTTTELPMPSTEPEETTQASSSSTPEEISTEPESTPISTPAPVSTEVPEPPTGLKYIGCYDPWKGCNGAETVSKFEEEPTLESCAAFCSEKSKPKSTSDIIIMRGMYCGCMTWENFNRQRVRNKFCHLKCPKAQDGGDLVSCGGNFAASLYCDPAGPQGDRCEEFIVEEFVQEVEIRLTQSFPLPSPPELIPVLPCFNSSDPNEISGPLSPSLAYFPQNAPDICVRFCSRDVVIEGPNNFLMTVRENTTYAVVGWKVVNFIPVPVCWCTNEVHEKYTEVENGKCNRICPGPTKDAEMCGGEPPFIFSMFCASPELCSKFEEPTTISSSVTTETTTAETTIETTPTSMTTTSGPCLLKCEVLNDFNGQNWKACAGTNAENPCPRSGKNLAIWKCSESGSFIGEVPDYSACSSEWFDDIEIGDGQILQPEDATEIFNKINDVVSTGADDVDYFGHEIPRIIELVSTVFNQLNVTISLADFESLIEKAVEINENVLVNSRPWKELPTRNRSILGTELITQIESNIFDLTARATHPATFTPRSEEKFYRKYFKTKSFGIKISSGGQPKILTGDSTLKFPFEDEKLDDGSYITLPQGWANAVRGDELNFIGSAISSKYIKPIYPSLLTNSQKLMNGKLMSFSLADGTKTTASRQITFPGEGVQIRFVHDVNTSLTKRKDLPRRQHEGEVPKPVFQSSTCVFWDTTELVWSSEGCKLISSGQGDTLCECSHLTSFAVLMDVHNYMGKEAALEILTIVLSSISVLCLSLTIFIFVTFRSTHSPRTTITRNLCISLLAGNTSILLVLDRHYFNMSEGLCTASAIVTHYVFLTAFTWMAVEGYHLYKMIVQVFDSGSRMASYRLFAYGVPLLIVVITTATTFLTDGQGYGGEMYCWLQGNYIWAFLAPVAVVIVGNSTTLFITLKTASKVNNGQGQQQLQEKIRNNKKWVKGCLSLTVILGLTWVTGYFILTGSITSIIAAYVFTVLNASQGIFLFILHCLLNEKVLEAARRRNLPVPSWLPSRTDTIERKPVSKSKSGENLKGYFAKELEEEEKRKQERIAVAAVTGSSIPGTERRRRSQNYDPTATVTSLESIRTGTTYTSGNESSASTGSIFNFTANQTEEESEI